MNFENLRNNYPELLSHMRASGYSEAYVYVFQQEIKWIIRNAESESWTSYEEVYQYYESVLKYPSSLYTKHAILGALKQFDFHGKTPNSKWSGLLKNSSYNMLISEFKLMVDYYSVSSAGYNLKPATIDSRICAISTFLLALQEMGIYRFEDVTEKAVMSIFVSPDGNPLMEQTYIWRISQVFKACLQKDPIVYSNIISFLPKFKRKRKNIQYLTKQETDKIRDSLDDITNALTLRDRAIGKLLLYTGLRSSDIVALSLDSIDWGLDIIRITQKKTGVNLELPMNAVVGNAIYDYLTDERGHTTTDALFSSQRGPAREMGSGNVAHAVKRIMKEAGIRQGDCDRRGAHIFRHRLATVLLGNDVSQVVVSSTLGHSSPRSTEAYFSADFVHLKTCALDIACFPLDKKVFNVE